MAKFYTSLSKRIQAFISQQKLFFVATSTDSGRINLSPKGMDTFRVLDDKTVAWLDLTGSGNETAAHLLLDGRITLMFCAFDGAPNIIRLYGKGVSILPQNMEWKSLISLFPKLPGTRQIFKIDVETVQTSCGMAIPFYDYREERNQLQDWAIDIGETGIKTYWKEKNKKSIDGFPTGI